MLLNVRKALTSSVDFGKSLLLPILIFHLLEFIGLIIIAINYEAPENRCYVGGVLPPDLEIDNLKTEKDEISLEDIKVSHIEPIAGKTIFFRVTQCYTRNSEYVIKLTARQACAVESAALHNPNFQVFVLFESPTYQTAGKELPYLAAIRSYKNVYLRQVNFWSYAEDTPVEDWVKKADLLEANFLSEYTTELLRFLTLYHFGGIYLDIDSMVLRSLENLPLNYVAAHDNETLENAVFSLEPMGIGHKLADKFLLDIQDNYDEEVNENFSVSLLNRMMVRICGQQDSKLCPELRVLNSSAFLAIPSDYWIGVLEPKVLETLSESSYILHSWNVNANKCLLKIGISSVFAEFAKKHCPKVYEVAAELF